MANRPTKQVNQNQDLTLITWYSEHKDRFHGEGDHWSVADVAKVATHCLGLALTGGDLLRVMKLLKTRWPKSMFCGRHEREIMEMVQTIQGPTPVWYPNAPTAKSDAKLEVKTEPVKETTPQPCLIEEVDRQRAIDNRFALLEQNLCSLFTELRAAESLFKAELANLKQSYAFAYELTDDRLVELVNRLDSLEDLKTTPAPETPAT